MVVQFRVTRLGLVVWLLLSAVVGMRFFSTYSTTSFAEEVPQGVDEPSGGVFAGMMLPFFGAGDQPPPGYVWADGKADWPDARWVPAHLMGKKVPDMRGYLLGSAGSQADVGSSWTNGRITVTGKVDGSDLALPPTEPGKSPGSFFALNTGPGVLANVGRVSVYEEFVFSNNAGKLIGYKGGADVTRVEFPRPTVFTTDALQKTAVLRDGVGRLNTSETLPPHIRCRWIIRIL